MRMTKENKDWIAHAIYLGQDQMELFSESRWEWISEPMNYLPLDEQCAFYRAYVRFGGKDDKAYDNREALNKAIEYAQGKIYDAFNEIDKRFNLGDD